MTMLINESILIALITGFISIITILLKYRIENRENIKNIKEKVDLMANQNNKQDEVISNINSKVETIEENVKKTAKTTDIENKILFKFFEMQFDLNKVIITDIKEGKHNGDLTEAEQKINNFKNIIDDEETKKIINK